MSGRTPGRPAVSVIIPAHNRADTIDRALRSVFAQTFQDFEIVVVDDASTDGLARAVQPLSDDRLQVVRREKRTGAPGARNAGITTSRGEWIAFLDSDDEWLPEKLEGQLDAARRFTPTCDVVYSACHRQRPGETPELRPKGALPEGDVLDALLAGLYTLTASAYMVRRTALMRVKGFDERFPSANDIDLWLRLASIGCRFAAVQDPLVIKHDSGAGQIKQDAVAKAIGFRRMDMRWGPVMQERLGHEAYERWRKRRLRTVTRRQEDRLTGFVASGGRGDALRYAEQMAVLLPWSRRYVARALGLAIGGPALYTRLAAAAGTTVPKD